MKKYCLIFLALFLTSSIYAQPLKIGYINIDHVVTSSPQFSQANDIVINKFKPKEAQLLLLNNKIKSLLKQFNKNKKDFSEKEVKYEVGKIAGLEKKLKQLALTLKKQLVFENKQALGRIQKMINQVILEVAKEQNFDLILYQKVAYASKKINITSLISQKLRQRFE